MRPPRFEEPTQTRTLGLIISISLILGILITALFWLDVPAQLIDPLSWFSLGAAGLSALLFLRSRTAYSRGLRLLAVLATVSLVYLFPEMFRPVCGDTPRAFAQDGCMVCAYHETYWDFYGNLKKRCAEWVDMCTDPVIVATLQCTQWGNSNWCGGELSLSLTATEAQGRDVLISGDVDGTVFACPTGAGTVSCSVPLPEGAGTVNYTATSSIGRSASGSTTYQRDSLQPQIDGWLDGTPGNDPWFVSSVDVNASASDFAPGSGLLAFEYSLDGGSWESFPGTLSILDGVHSLSLRATDGAGNVVETSQTIQVDTIIPVLNLSLIGTAGELGWYISTVELQATIADDGSGPAVLEASVNGGEWSAYTAPLVFSDGQHSYQFRALDHSGNLIETPLQGLSVDTIPPVIDLPASWTLGQIAPFKLQDDGSGLAGLRLVIEDEDERYPKVAWDDNLSGDKFRDEIAWDGRFKDGSQASPGGEYYAWLKVTDNAGNESTQAGQIIVDAVVPPSINIPGKAIAATEAPASTETESKSSSSPLSLPANVSPVTSFGGGNNGLQPSAAQVGKKSFTVGPATTSQAPDFQSSVLWGASATAAIGAFAAEIARRKREEEEARAAQRAANAEINQARKRIAAAYRASLNSFNAAVEKARAFGMSETEADKLKTDVVKSGKIGASLGAAQEYVVRKVKEIQELKEAERIARKEELLDPQIPPKPAYILPDMSWKANDYAQLEHAGEVAAQTKVILPKEEKSWWEKSLDWIDNHQVEISLGVGVVVGIAAIVMSGGAATPLVAAAWIAGSAAVAGGLIAGGTIGLNAYFGRPLGTNVLRNFGYAAGAAIATTVVGFALSAVAPAVTRSVASFCGAHVTTCTIAAPIFKGVDYGFNAYDTWQADRTLNDPNSSSEDRLIAGLTIGLALWSEVLEPDELLPVSLPLDDIARRQIIRKYSEILKEKGSKEALEYLKGVLGKDAPILKVLRAVDDSDAAIKLFTTLDKDVLEYALEQGPDAVRALAKWDKTFLEEYGIELALRSGQDAKALQATKELISLGPIDPSNLTLRQQELIATIAENSVQQINKGQVVVGKWTTFDSGFSGYALDSSSIHYSQHPDLWPMLGEFGDKQSEVAWLINQKAIRSKIDESLPFEYTFKGIEPAKLDREMAAIEAIWNNAPDAEILDALTIPDGNIPYRMKELQELYQAGYIYTYDEVYNSYIFVKP